MTDHNTTQLQIERLLTSITEQLTTLTAALSDWMTSQPRTLGELEQQVLRSIKDLGAQLLSGLAHLAVPAYPPPTTPCSCGHQATSPRLRTATVKTVLGSIRLQRPYYSCAVCHHGTAPLDLQLGVCAGGISAGLDELLALVGATEDSFQAAAEVLEKLTLVQVCPNTVRASTEELGQLLAAHDQQLATTAQLSASEPPLRQPGATRMYISIDGVQVHIRQAGWKEMKLGSVYCTRERRTRRHPERCTVSTIMPSFVADLKEAAAFGPQLWAEAASRGVLLAAEVVVLGDGSHWIWDLAKEYFPDAVQILDWYHASSYVWAAASAIYGEGSSLAKVWATEQLSLLWEGAVEEVLNTLQSHTSAGEAVEQAHTYYSYHQGRMNYAEYRARGMQIGSGTIESGCKQVIGARLKQAGMSWAIEGATAVATVRSWLKSGRWAEGMALRPKRRRKVRQERAAAEQNEQQQREEAKQGRVATKERAKAGEQSKAEKQAVVVEQPVVREAREEAARGRPAASHPWRKSWSLRQQCREAEARMADATIASAA